MTNLDEILVDIFGPDFQTFIVLSLKEEYVTSTRIAQIDSFIEFMLSKANDVPDTISNDGRLGPKIVSFDTSTTYGYFFVSPDKLDINCRRNFSTIRANVGIYKGKWMYELQLGTKGIMQVGWSTIHSKFNEESGVGDVENSYAYDGKRVKKWNISSSKYGEPWLSGDIITCALDADEGTVDFYRNGRHLGRAFESIALGSGIAYFPTVSLSLGETLKANFGNVPLRYPVEGYLPLQAAPVNILRQATLLIKWLYRLTSLITNRSSNDFFLDTQDSSMTMKAFLICIARSILKYLNSFLKSSYVINALFVPFLEDQLTQDVSINKIEHPQLTLTLDLLWAFLKPAELKVCLEAISVYLLSTFRHNPMALEYSDQCRSLILLTSLCKHTFTRQYLLQNILFYRVKFANFIHIKPLNEISLEEVVDSVWWETDPPDPSIECNKKAYMAACDKIRDSTARVEALQVKFLVTLLTNTDATDKRPSSRDIFLKNFRNFIYDNFDSHRFDQMHPTPLPVALCCFHRLLIAFRVLWDSEVGENPVHVPCRTFYDNTIQYSEIERLGGILSHLQKTYESDLIRILGQDHEIFKPANQMQQLTNNSTLQINARPLDTANVDPNIYQTTDVTGSSRPFLIQIKFRFEKNPLSTGPTNPALSLIELLDGIILFYHVSAQKQVAKMASLRETIAEYTVAISDIKSRLEQAKKVRGTESLGVLQEMSESLEFFHEKLSKEARHMAWVRAYIYSQEKQMQLSWLLKTVLLTLRTASKEGNMFSFVPDFYLKSLANLYTAIHKFVHPTAPIEKIIGYEMMLEDVAQFLCDHFMDPRIVIASAKDGLILTLCQFVSNPLTMKALENVPVESRLKMVSNLLKPLENRAWSQSNVVLVRFWRGCGFAFRYDSSPHIKKTGSRSLSQEILDILKPCPSLIYQAHVKEILMSNPQIATNFLDSMLNQLNWAFSEFITVIQEIHNIYVTSQRYFFIEQRQLKMCVTSFEFTILLLRVLEMIVTIIPNIFNDLVHTCGSLLPRLCQLLCQILNRVSSHTSCFQRVVQFDIYILESIDHLPILSAVIGILLALLEQDINNFKHIDEVPFVTKVLLMEPSFQITSLEFVLNDVPTDIKKEGLKPFSFLMYKDIVSGEEVRSVDQMIKYLHYCYALLPDMDIVIDEENMCMICYAYPIAVTFKPCNHVSCQSCIDRYLMISHECFFCKITIEKVVDFSGAILHDFSGTNANQNTVL